MALKIVLKPHEKLVVNGAVITAGDHHTELHFLNKARFLRQKDILTEEKVNSSESLLYFIVQLLYIDPESRETYDKRLIEVIGLLYASHPQKAQDIDEILTLVNETEYYKALKACQKAFPSCLAHNAP